MTDYQSKKLTVTIPARLIKQIDKLAKYSYSSRSDVVRLAILQYLRDPANASIVDPKSEAYKLAYDSIKVEHPYVDPNDFELIQILVAQKVQKKRKKSTN